MYYNIRKFMNKSQPIKTMLRNVLASANKQMIAGCIRVQPEELDISDKGVFLKLNEKFIAIESLAADSVGLFGFFGESDDEGNELWECSYCHTLNKMSRTKCKRCGTWR